MELEVRRQVLRRLTYGMYVMTASAEGRIAASTLTWLSQCSFAPPLVMIGIQAASRIHETVEKAGAIAVNILREGQEKIAETFFRTVAVEGNRLGGLAFEPGPATGAPLLTDLPAWFEARHRRRCPRRSHGLCGGGRQRRPARRRRGSALAREHALEIRRVSAPSWTHLANTSSIGVILTSSARMPSFLSPIRRSSSRRSFGFSAS